MDPCLDADLVEQFRDTLGYCPLPGPEPSP